jgi:hypothetical protein
MIFILNSYRTLRSGVGIYVSEILVCASTCTCYLDWGSRDQDMSEYKRLRSIKIMSFLLIIPNMSPTQGSFCYYFFLVPSYPSYGTIIFTLLRDSNSLSYFNLLHLRSVPQGLVTAFTPLVSKHDSESNKPIKRSLCSNNNRIVTPFQSEDDIIRAHCFWA